MPVNPELRNTFNRVLMQSAACTLPALVVLAVWAVDTRVLAHREVAQPLRTVQPKRARFRSPWTKVEAGSGIEVVAGAPAGMFPSSWNDPWSPTTASPPEYEKIPDAVTGIERALRKYPNDFLRKNLKRIYIVDNLVVDGEPSGGVNCPETLTIYVDLDNLGPGEVAQWSEETIHHEFAHLLTDTHDTARFFANWTKLNKRGVKYGSGGTDAIRNGHDGDDVVDKYWRDGFVEEYGKADRDEDFATFCERLFSGDKRIKGAEAKYLVMRRKADAVVSFYHALDPTFTKSYFDALPPSSR